MSLSSTRCALVVGGTSGIGHGIALALARNDYEVTIVGRSVERGHQVVEQLSNVSSKKHSFEVMDAFDLTSVKKFASARTSPVDFLVMTQGMATIQGYTPTMDNIDQKLQLHYFSRIYLARLLASRMTEGSRILTVLSAGVHGRYAHFNDDFKLQHHYSIKNAADAAGFYTDAGFQQLAEDFGDLVVAHAAPGFVNTNWGTEMPWMLRSAIRPLQSLFGKNLEDCGSTLTKGCLDISTPGYHLLDQNGQTIENDVKHTAVERDLIWEKTLQVLPDL